MSRVLISTTSGWNAGDDWIRDGLLRAIQLREEISTIWWNRGWGIAQTHGNAPGVNLPLADYVIMAGTPEWIDRTTAVYRHCLDTDTRIALLGIGKTGGYREEKHGELMRAVVDAGLIEIAIVRDQIAQRTLAKLGVDSQVMCDPAMFHPPSVPGGDRLIIGWRGLGPITWGDPYEFSDQDRRLTFHLTGEWDRAAGKDRIVTVHDNREMAAASELFGKKHVRYSSDYRELMHHYWRCGHYVGARIHGFVGALIHGASAHLIYHSNKAVCAQVIVDRLGLEESAAVTILEEGNASRIERPNLKKPTDIWSKIDKERRLFRRACLQAPGLSQLMEVNR